jgi:hypothetical protein
LRNLVLKKRAPDTDEPTEVLSRCRRWGHGGVDVFSFNHKKCLSPTTHVFDGVEWGLDAASNGGGTFTEVVRCPFETFSVEQLRWRCTLRGARRRVMQPLASLLNSRKVQSSISRLLGGCCRFFRIRCCVVCNTIPVGKQGRCGGYPSES